MELEVRTTILPEFEAQFSVKASEAGVTTYVQQLIIADLQKPRSVAEILAPFRTEVEQCDITLFRSHIKYLLQKLTFSYTGFTITQPLPNRANTSPFTFS